MIQEPELRFPGFTDPWRELKLGECFRIGSGKDYKHLGKGDIPVYGTGGYMLSVDDYLYDGESVCIGRKGTIDHPLFLSGKFWTVDTLFYTYDFQNSLPKFILYIFQRIKWQKYNEASGVPSLSKRTIEKIKINLPSLPEQQKIADFLTAVDEKIEIQTQKIDRLETYKRGVMQKLLGGEIRFPGFTEPWREVRLGDVFAERSERCGDCNLPLLAVTNSQGVILRDQLDRHDISSSDKSNYKIVRKNDIAYNSMRMWQGTSGVSRYEGIISPAYTVIYLKKDYDINFFGYLFKLQRVIFDFYRYSQGLTSDTWNLKYRQLSEIKVTITPLKKEQQKIADFLTAIDNKIELEKERLEHLQTYKKGLLQKMFI